MSDPVCPQCGKDFVQRVSRDGLLERLVSLAYVYPYRCQFCTHRFHAMEWGVRYERQMIDKRQFERHPVHCPATLSWEQGQGTGTVTDLSVQGCKLTTEARLQPTTILQLQVRLTAQEPALVVEAATVRSAQAGTIGVHFLRLQPEAQETLSEFVHDLWAGREPAPDEATVSDWTG